MDKVRAIFGTGGFGREVMQIARRDLYQGHALIFIEDKPRANYVNDVLVMSTDDFLAIHSDKCFNVCVGDPKHREEIVFRLLHDAEPFSIISTRASIIHPVEIGFGAVILDGARISCNSRIGDHTHINYNAVIGHDCNLDSFVTVAPGANINGWTQLSRGAYIGANAVLKNGLGEPYAMSVGRYATVGMGAVVTRNVPEKTIVVGNPARELKKVNE